MSDFVDFSVLCNWSSETSSECLVLKLADGSGERKGRPQGGPRCHTGKHLFASGHLVSGL